MAAATSQAGNAAGRRRGPPGHCSGQLRRPVRQKWLKEQKTRRRVHPDTGHAKPRRRRGPAGLASSKRDRTQREKPRSQVSGNCGPGKAGEALRQWPSGNCSPRKTESLPEREGEISG